MHYLQAFREPQAIKGLLNKIEQQLSVMPARAEPWRFMEVCGGHTHAIFRYGLDRLLPKNITFIHGPGCPVCVLPQNVIDQAISLAKMPNVIFCSYGDPLRVPGHQGSLQQARAAGADVRSVYSPRDALKIAEKEPHQQVIFFAIGFETTTPATALSLLEAEKKQLRNFKLLCHHVTIGPPLRALLSDSSNQIDGFIAPGHVSLITGASPYQFICQQYHKPVVISGFEPFDLLQSLLLLLKQLAQSAAKVENQYSRAASAAGNKVAQAAIDQVFNTAKSTEWRGLGALPHSGLELKTQYQDFDATALLTNTKAETSARGLAHSQCDCQCEKVLRGQMQPISCPLFAGHCSPQNPQGALMVSAEGACAAWYQYRRQDQKQELSS